MVSRCMRLMSGIQLPNFLNLFRRAGVYLYRNFGFARARFRARGFYSITAPDRLVFFYSRRAIIFVNDTRYALEWTN